MIGLVLLFVFYAVVTPGEMELWEASALTGWWVLYALMVYYTDFLAKRCCCCLGSKAEHEEKRTPAPTRKIAVPSDEEDAGDDEEDVEARVESVNTASTSKKRAGGVHQRSRSMLHPSNGHLGVSFPPADNEQYPSEFYHGNIHLSAAIREEPVEDDVLKSKLEQLNPRQRRLVNENGWLVVVMPENQAEDARRHLHLRRPTLMELWMKQQVDARVDARMDGVFKSQGPSRLSRAFLKLGRISLKPWHAIFSKTLFEREGVFPRNRLILFTDLFCFQARMRRSICTWPSC